MNTKMNKNEIVQNEKYIEGIIPYLVFLFFISLLYYKSLFFGFVDYDDSDLLVKKGYIFSSFSNINYIFSTDVFLENQSSYYRPILNLIFLLEYNISSDPVFFHLMNIVYHFIATCLGFYILTLLSFSKKSTFIVCMIFAVHPALIQAVSWIPGRNDSLLTIFILLSFLMLLKIISNLQIRKIHHFLLFTVFFNLALYTKETSLLFLIICLSFIYFIKQIKLRELNVILLICIQLFSIIIYIYIRNQIIAFQNDSQIIPEISSTNLIGFITYIQKLVLPKNLSPIPLKDSFDLDLIIYSFLLLAVIFLFCKIQNYRLFFFGIFWFVIFLYPAYRNTNGFNVNFEHRLYLPFMGLIISLQSIRFPDIPKRLYKFLFVLLFFFCYIIHPKYSLIFSDKHVFWEKVIKDNPTFSVGYTNLANIYMKENNFKYAEKNYIHALLCDSTNANANNNYGYFLKKNGKQDSALIYFKRAIRNKENFPEALNNLANVLIAKGQLKEAEDYLNKAVMINPLYFEAINGLAITMANQKQYKEAEIFFLRAIQINPDFAEAYFNLALLYLNTHQKERAITEYNRALLKGMKPSPYFEKNVK